MLLTNQVTELSNSDLYTGYNEYDPLLDSKNLQFDQRFQQAVLRSSYGERSRTAATTGTGGGLTSRKSRAGSRRGTTLNLSQLTSATNSTADNARPVTAVRAAGYTRGSLVTESGYRQQDSFSHGSFFDPFGQQTRLTSGNLQKQDDDFIGMNKTKSLQLKIHKLYQESVLAAQRSDFALALEKAKQCVARERSLQKHMISLVQPKDSNSKSSLLLNNLEILIAVQVNLAVQLTRNRLYQEAISIYQSIAKIEVPNNKDSNKKASLNNRFKCNIGCIYFAEGKYQNAIKFFRMALDQTPSEHRGFRMKITRNLAFCFVKMGKYLDALSSFDYILSKRSLYIDAFRLLVCNYAIKDVTGMKTSFLKLLESRNHLYEHSSLNKFISLSSDNKEFNETFHADTTLADSYEEEDDDEDEDDLTDDHLNDPHSVQKTFLSNNYASANNSKFYQQQSNQQTTSTLTKTRSAEDDANLLLKRAIRNDLLSIVHNEQIKQRNWCILTAAKLIAGEIAMNERIENGFVWCASSIKHACNGTTDLNLITSTSDSTNNDLSSFSFGGSSRLADELIAELQLACAELYLLKRRELKQAIIILKVFEQSLSSSANKRLWTAKYSALTNLAYIYLLQGQIGLAHSYLNQVLELDHLHVGALVNKGCCFLLEGQLDQSREYFSEALLNEPNSISAIYNLALANRQAGRLEGALDLLFRLNNLIMENEFCIYQIANIYEQLKDRDQALDWYERLLAKEPSDVYLLNKISDLFDAFMYLSESYRQNPAHIPTLERLAAHYIETKAYEKAIDYLKQASTIEPRKIKYLLMVAACYIRANNYQQAIAYYRLAHSKFPQNLDCLKHLFRLSEKFGLLDEQIIYAERIAKLEKANEQRERRVQSGDSGQHSASSTSSFNRLSSTYQSTRTRNEANSGKFDKRLTKSSSKFSLNDEDLSSSKGVNEASNHHLFSASNSNFQMTNKRSETNDLTSPLFSFENQPDQRPMTSRRRKDQTNEDQLANDFTTEELSRFLP